MPVSEILEHRLADAKQAFTFIIIDCPPTLDLLQDSVYDFAHAAIVPVKFDYLPGAAGAAQHTQGILEAQADGIDIKVEMIVPRRLCAHVKDWRGRCCGTLKDTYSAKRVSRTCTYFCQG